MSKLFKNKPSIYYDFKIYIRQIEYFFWQNFSCKSNYKKNAEIATKRGDLKNAIKLWEKAENAFSKDDDCKIFKDLCLLELSRNVNFIRNSRREELLDKVNHLLKKQSYLEALKLFSNLIALNPLPSSRLYLIAGDILEKVVFRNIDHLNDFDEDIYGLFKLLCSQSPISFMGTGDYPVICSMITNNILEKDYQKIINYLKLVFSKTKLLDNKNITLSCLLVAFGFVDKDKKAVLMEEFFDEFWVYNLWPMVMILYQYSNQSENVEIFCNLLEKNSANILENIPKKSPKQIFYYITISKALSNNFYKNLITKLKESDLKFDSKLPYALDLEYILGKKNLAEKCSEAFDYKISTLNSNPRKPKIAVCISGQLRGYKKAYQTWKKFGASDYDVTYFIHSWKNIGRANLDGDRANRSLSGKFLEEWKNSWFMLGEGEMRKRYKHFFESCFVEGLVTKQEIEEFYGTKNVIIEDDESAYFADFSNPKKMYYKAYECHKMMRNFSDDFDLVIRIRPDKELMVNDQINWNEIYQKLLQKPSLMVDLAPIVTNGKYKNFFIGDQVAIGLTSIMDIYAGTYKITNQVQKMNLDGFAKDYITHANFGLSCLYHNIEVNAIDAFNCGSLLSVDIIAPEKVLAAISKDIKISKDERDIALLNAAIYDAKNHSPLN